MNTRTYLAGLLLTVVTVLPTWTFATVCEMLEVATKPSLFELVPLTMLGAVGVLLRNRDEDEPSRLKQGAALVLAAAVGLGIGMILFAAPTEPGVSRTALPMSVVALALLTISVWRQPPNGDIAFGFGAVVTGMAAVSSVVVLLGLGSSFVEDPTCSERELAEPARSE